MLSNNPNTVKVWETETLLEMIKTTHTGRMMMRGTIMRPEDLMRSKRGDETTISYTTILTGIGQGEGGTLVGNEESLNNESFTMVWNVFRHAVASPNDNTIEQQRTYIDFYKTAKKALNHFHMSRLDASVFNQLAGVNTTTITVDTTTYAGADRTYVQGLNTINAPSTNRIIRASGAATDEALTSSDTFTLDLIDAAQEKMALTYPTAEPMIGQEYDLYISPEQFTDLKRDTTGKVQWYPNSLAQTTSGSNILETAAHSIWQPIGKYAQTNILVANRVAFGQNSSTSAAIPTVRRAIFCGKNALAFGSAFSGDFKDIMKSGDDGSVPLKYFDELKDFGYTKALEARMIYGAKKIQFDSEDYGSMVIATYAAPHTS
jgi:hypothetical protein